MYSALAPLLSLLTSGVLLWLGHGLLLTYLPIAANSIGFKPWAIGLTAAFYFLGFVSGCLLTPRVLFRVGHIRGFALLASIYTATVLLLGMVDGLGAWLLLRLVVGASVSGLYMIFESWLSEASQLSNRGTVLSVYSMLNLGMIAGGQQLLHVPVDNSMSYFAIAAILLTLSVIPVSLTQTAAPRLENPVTFNLLGVWRRSHIGLLGAVVAGLVTGGYWAMAPVYAELIGMSRQNTAWFVSVSVLGGALCQLPIGRLSDNVDRRIVIQYLSLLASIVCALLYFATNSLQSNSMAFIILALLWGASCTTMYAISLAHANDWAQTHEFVEISGSMLIMFGVSSALGAVLSSFFMGLIGPGGLYAYMAAVLFVFAMAVLLRRQSHTLPTTADTIESFQSLPGMTTPVLYEMDPRHEAEKSKTDD